MTVNQQGCAIQAVLGGHVVAPTALRPSSSCSGDLVGRCCFLFVSLFGYLFVYLFVCLLVSWVVVVVVYLVLFVFDPLPDRSDHRDSHLFSLVPSCIAYVHRINLKNKV
ncbi:unnamed protein product [Polarella glacialis]|uniref:Uncharacterized protein n=1 Tax=Polarella glacialis TaxID=89957 RepID=A0A813KPC8_POLGL|nr:unnamed protein product [Polarella glacialis]CAE8706554.1 unnamed protein product [Polarella glacialis]